MFSPRHPIVVRAREEALILHGVRYAMMKKEKEKEGLLIAFVSL
jgi:hypothetical protein